MAGTLRGDTVLETKATLKVVGTSLKRVLIYSKTDKATLCSLPLDTSCKLYFERDSIFFSYVPATALSASNCRVHP